MNPWINMELLKLFGVVFLVVFGSAAVAEFDECPEFEGPRVWIDNAPDCLANSTYCRHFGLEYVCRANITDEGHVCLGGTQVMCTYPPTERLAPPLPVKTLKLITYNIWELKYLVAQIGQRERTCRIPAQLLQMQPDGDVIVIQEMFMGGCIVNANNSLTVRDILAEHGFSHYTRTVGDSLAILPSGAKAGTINAKRNSSADNGGVVIASRWPIIKEKQTVFENYDGTTSDALSAKGVMYAQVRKTVDGESKDFHIFGTHMQSTDKAASPGIRVLQAGEIFNFMKSLEIPPDEPVIYAGDLNGDLLNKTANAMAIMEALNATLPEATGPIQVTYDHQNNDNLDPTATSKNGEFLDYVLTSNIHEQPVKSTIQIIRPRSQEPFEVCRDFRLFKFFMYPQSDDCRKAKFVSDLADHYPVVGVFEFTTGTEGARGGATSMAGGRSTFLVIMAMVILLITT